MSRLVSRFAYRQIVRLHPAWFRERFGEEMMCIFEEESQRGATARVLLDGLLSLMRQRCLVADTSTQICAPSGFLIEDSGIGAGRFVQATLMSSVLISSFIFLIDQRIPSPVLLRMRAIWCSTRSPCRRLRISRCCPKLHCIRVG